jgi:hypothetical protein
MLNTASGKIFPYAVRKESFVMQNEAHMYKVKTQEKGAPEHTAMHTTLTAEGTETSGFVKFFWASRNPSAELYRNKQ